LWGLHKQHCSIEKLLFTSIEREESEKVYEVIRYIFKTILVLISSGI
jgi:hypothetical protein